MSSLALSILPNPCHSLGASVLSTCTPCKDISGGGPVVPPCSFSPEQLATIQQIKTNYTSPLAAKQYQDIPCDVCLYINLLDALRKTQTDSCYATNSDIALLMSIVEDGLQGAVNAYNLNIDILRLKIDNNYLEEILHEYMSGQNSISTALNADGGFALLKKFELAPLFKQYITIYGLPPPGLGFDPRLLKMVYDAMVTGGLDPGVSDICAIPPQLPSPYPNDPCYNPCTYINPNTCPCPDVSANPCPPYPCPPGGSVPCTDACGNCVQYNSPCPSLPPLGGASSCPTPDLSGCMYSHTTSHTHSHTYSHTYTHTTSHTVCYEIVDIYKELSAYVETLKTLNQLYYEGQVAVVQSILTQSMYETILADLAKLEKAPPAGSTQAVLDAYAEYENIRSYISQSIASLYSAVKQYDTIVHYEQVIENNVARLEILTDPVKLKKYVEEFFSKSRSILPDQFLQAPKALLKPQYARYIELYGFPDFGAFDPVLLGDILKQLGLGNENLPATIANPPTQPAPFDNTIAGTTIRGGVVTNLTNNTKTNSPKPPPNSPNTNSSPANSGTPADTPTPKSPLSPTSLTPTSPLTPQQQRPQVLRLKFPDRS